MAKNSFMIFDGECGFCNKSILFFAKIDTKNEFLFISNKSALGIALLEKNKISEESKDTIILMLNDKYYLKSNAIFKYLQNVEYNVYLNLIFKFIPISISDFIYEYISKNRKKIIKSNVCEIPSLENLKKIINK